MTWSEDLELDLGWREAELASVKLLILSASRDSVREQVLLRALWVLLYAHFEGFCQFAWDLYLDVLQTENIVRSSCTDNIVCLSLEGDFKKFRGNLATANIWTFFTVDLPGLLSAPTTFASKLDTTSNLWPDVFRENADRASLPTGMILEHNSKIRALVSRRNDIAHGQRMVIRGLTDYQPYEEAALLVMHELAVGVIEAIEDKKYLKSR